MVRFRRGAVAGALAALVAVMLPASPAQGASGDLDRSFDGDGLASVAFPDQSGKFADGDVVVQPDGKIIIAGNFITPKPPTSFELHVGLARFNPDGTLDTDRDSTPGTWFGSDRSGKVVTDFGRQGGGERVESLALQSDGKLLVAGQAKSAVSTGAGLDNDFVVARFHPNGTLDSCFGTTVPCVQGLGGNGPGWVLTDFGGGHNDLAYALAIQRVEVGVDEQGNPVVEDRIAVAGSSTSVTASTETMEVDFALARYRLDGTPDTCFGSTVPCMGGAGNGTGRVLTDFKSGGQEPFITSLDWAFALAVQEVSGRELLVAAGQAHREDFALARYEVDGSLDETFGPHGDGRVVEAFNSSSQEDLRDLAVQPDGKLVATGRTLIDREVGYEVAVLRFEPRGFRDPTFGNGGLVHTASGEGVGIAVQADGRLVVGASGSANVLRYLADGRLDPIFGTGGRGVSALTDSAEALAVQPDGKPVVLTKFSFNLARFFAENPDLRIAMADAPDPVRARKGSLTYTITVANPGDAASPTHGDARGVVVSDRLPAGVMYKSAASSQGSCSFSSATAEVSCAVGTLGEGSSATVSIVVVPTTKGTLTNTATVSSTTADANTANNSATATTTVT